jgi:hypothetical protein
LADNTVNISNNTKALTDANKVPALAVHAEKTKNMMMPRHTNAGQNHITDLLPSKNVKFRVYNTLLLYE